MQCHFNIMLENNMPKFLVKNPMVNDQFVIIPSDKDIMSSKYFPWSNGTTNSFPVKAATLAEYASDLLPKLQLVAEAPEWNP